VHLLPRLHIIRGGTLVSTLSQRTSVIRIGLESDIFVSDSSGVASPLGQYLLLSTTASSAVG